MFLPGVGPEDALWLVRERQREVRERVREGARAGRVQRHVQGARLTAFRLWRLHVMVWVEDQRGV